MGCEEACKNHYMVDSVCGPLESKGKQLDLIIAIVIMKVLNPK